MTSDMPSYPPTTRGIQGRTPLRTAGMSTDTLVRRSARLVVDDIDFAAFAEHPLDADTLRCLRYMCDVESHTICYLRELLATRVHQDPEITSFLACWSYEEYWHGEAISRVLQAHDMASAPVRAGEIRRQRRRRDDLRLYLFAAASSVSRHLPAVHMAWGAVNEWSTQAGYARLAARANHPQLTELLKRIMRQEGRHIDFYAGQARQRLADSVRAQRVTRFALRHFWAPVGSGVMPESEVQFLCRHLFSGDDGVEVARRIDRHVSRLPGLHDLHLLENSVQA